MKKRLRKNYFQKSKRAQRDDKANILKHLIEIQDFLKTIGLKFADNISILPMTDGENLEKLKINIMPQIDNTNILQRALSVKDINNVSDKAYQAFRNLGLTLLPSLRSLKSERKYLNGHFNIKQSNLGVFVSLQEKLLILLPNIIFKNIEKLNDNTITLKFSGDSTKVGRNRDFLNFTVTIINEGQKAKTSKGNYTLGIFNIDTENYDTLSQCLNELAFEIDNFNDEIIVRDKVFKIKKKFGGDWKFLASILGLRGANGKNPCLYCKWENSKEKAKTPIGKEWSVTDVSKKARSIKEAIALAENNIQKDGYARMPIFKSIDTQDYVVDMLHLFLRITDKLEALFFLDLEQLDYLNKTKTQQKYLNDLKEKFNINKPFYVKENHIELSSLMGPQKERLFQNINVKDYANEHEKINEIEKIWKDFWIIYNEIRDNNFSPDQIKMRTDEWWQTFKQVYHESHETPYIHVFVNHLQELSELHGDINNYNQQGLEKLNDLTTTHFFRNTNRKQNYIKQMMEKRNRLELYSINHYF